MKSLYSASACASPWVPPSRIPAIGDGQLGLGQIFAGVVGVDQGLQRQPRDFEAAVLDIVDGLVEQHLVGLLRVLGDGVVVLLAANAAASSAGPPTRQNRSGRTNRVSNHIRIHSPSTALSTRIAVAFAAISRISRTVASGSATVKHRRPCDDPITPGAHHFRQILLVNAAIDFDRQR